MKKTILRILTCFVALPFLVLFFILAVAFEIIGFLKAFAFYSFHRGEELFGETMKYIQLVSKKPDNVLRVIRG